MPEDDLYDLDSIKIEESPSYSSAPPPPPPVRMRERHHSGQHAMGAVGPDPSELMNLPPPSPHSRIYRRRARKAIRRTKTSLDSRPLRKQLTDLDPREPQDLLRASEGGKPAGRMRTRQLSLPEGAESMMHPIDPAVFVTSRTVNETDKAVQGGDGSPALCTSSSNNNVSVNESKSPSKEKPLEEVPAETILEQSDGACAESAIPDTPVSDMDSVEVDFLPHNRPPSGRSSHRRPLQREEKVDMQDLSPKLEEPDVVVLEEGPIIPLKDKALCTEHPPPVVASTPQTQLPGYSPGILDNDSSPSTPAPQDTSSTHTSDVSSNLTVSSTLTPPASRSVTPSTFYTPESSRPSSTTDTTSEFSTTYSDDSPYTFRIPEKRTPILELDEKSESSSTLTETTTTLAENNGDSNGEKSKPLDGTGKGCNIFKLPGFLRKSSEETAVSLPVSQQSSVVGLDWLFSTDSDSLSSRK